MPKRRLRTWIRASFSVVCSRLRQPSRRKRVMKDWDRRLQFGSRQVTRGWLSNRRGQLLIFICRRVGLPNMQLVRRIDKLLNRRRKLQKTGPVIQCKDWKDWMLPDRGRGRQTPSDTPTIRWLMETRLTTPTSKEETDAAIVTLAVCTRLSLHPVTPLRVANAKPRVTTIFERVVSNTMASLFISRPLPTAHLNVSDRFDFVRRRVLSLKSLLIKLYTAATTATLRSAIKISPWR